MDKQNLPARRQGRPPMSTETRANIILQLRNADVSFKEIAKNNGVSIKTVSNVYNDEKAKETQWQNQFN